MTGKYAKMLVAVLALGYTTAVWAQPIHERVERAHARIEQGMRSGALTRREAERLKEEFNSVRRDEARARADGHLDRRERERLDRELDRLERNISHLKQNEETRRRY